MKTIRVGAAAINTTPLDWEGNLRKILRAIDEARSMGVGILCLPELCVTGYGCEDAFHTPHVALSVDKAFEIARGGMLASEGANMALRHIGQHSYGGPDLVFCVGVPVLFQNALFNCVAVFRNSTLLGLVAKKHLAGDGLHYEPRWFRPWPRGHRDVLRLPTGEVPIGDLVFDIEGVRIGFEICEDAWVADRPGVDLARKGVDIILNPSASHFGFGKHAIRERFVTEGSRAFGVTYVYANLLGNESGRSIYDGDTFIATGGSLVARGRRFSYEDVVLTTAVVDIEATRVTQARTASFSPNFDEQGVVRSTISSIVPGSTEAPLSPEIPVSASGAGQDLGARLWEFGQAVPLGLFDYLRKSGARGFVVSLSGGADSAACAALVRLMVREGVEGLGFAEFCEKLHLPHTAAADRHGGMSEGALMANLLTCVYQASENSSTTTASAAQEVALGLGAEYHHIDVSPVIQTYTSLVSKALGRDLTWEGDDIALQNIQARSRAPSAWMFANLKGALLLATSNRSEASVGYCTMDGDTAGSIAPIGGIDKPFLRRWLQHLVDTDSQFACLRSVTAQQPTAELRPQSANQTDEKDLMPYEVLDAAEKAAIRDKRSPVDVFRVLRDRFRRYSSSEIHMWVRSPGVAGVRVSTPTQQTVGSARHAPNRAHYRAHRDGRLLCVFHARHEPTAYPRLYALQVSRHGMSRPVNEPCYECQRDTYLGRMRCDHELHGMTCSRKHGDDGVCGRDTGTPVGGSW